MLYPRDPSLDPQLVWKGKDEQDREPLEVDIVPIYIQEVIEPRVIINAVQARKTTGPDTGGFLSGCFDAPLDLILEVTGERKKEKEAKTSTARTLWVPAVNNHGGFGRWAFLEITDPYDDVVEMIRSISNQASLSD
jgi:hypothetical protein